jgi:N-acetylglucosaminyl-diphospho-decaprenol L-rhamnosyltransferase
VQDATGIIVNYNSGERLGPLLDVLVPQVKEIVVVDNASVDGSDLLAEGKEGVRLIRNAANLGFAAAVNRGAMVADGAWLLLVNPDVHLEPGAADALLSRVPDDVAVVAPLQIDDRGNPRPETGGYEPTLLRYLVWAIVPNRWHGRFGPWLAPPFPTGDVDVDWASGAFLAIRRPVFERLGALDERYFLYHEDVDFGRRARRAHHRVVCRGGVRVHHELAHGERDRRISSGLRSLESVARDFTGWRRRALGVIMGLGYALRASLGSTDQRALARAVLPTCVTLLRGELPPSSGGT